LHLRLGLLTELQLGLELATTTCREWTACVGHSSWSLLLGLLAARGTHGERAISLVLIAGLLLPTSQLSLIACAEHPGFVGRQERRREIVSQIASIRIHTQNSIFFPLLFL